MSRSPIRRFFLVIQEASLAWIRDRAMRLSAGLSFYTFLSLAPLILVTLRVAGVFWRRHANVQKVIVHQMTVVMGPEAAGAIWPILDAQQKHISTTATVLSTLLLLFSATSMFMELQDAMNAIWQVNPKPNNHVRQYVRSRLISLAMVLALGLILLLSIAASGLTAGISSQIRSRATWLGFPGRVLIGFAVSILFFAFIYKVLPAVDLQWKHVWTGALAAAILFTLGRYGLAIYFHYGSLSTVFGVAGSLAAILLWVYYSSFSLFFGAEFAKAWAHRYYLYHPKPMHHAELIDPHTRARSSRNIVPNGQKPAQQH